MHQHQPESDRDRSARTEFQSAATFLSRQDFCRTYDHPFLIVSAGRNAAKSSYLTTTSSVVRGEQQPFVARDVRPLRKRPGANEFSFITIGRAPNSDILVEDSSVSKCHAMVHMQERRYFITDAQSRYGLRLNGDGVEAGRKRELSIDDEISLSPAAMIIVIDAAAAYLWYRGMQAVK